MLAAIVAEAETGETEPPAPSARGRKSAPEKTRVKTGVLKQAL